MSQSTPNQPLRVFRVGNIRSVIWENIVQWDGQTKVRQSVQLRKSYRDWQTGNLKDTDCFLVDDLPAVILVAQKAYRSCQARHRRRGGHVPQPQPAPKPMDESAQAAEHESCAAENPLVDELDQAAQASEQ